MAKSSNSINIHVILLTVSTFFVAIAAIASLIAVSHSIKVWNEQKELNRPYFTIVEPGFKKLPESPPYRIQITLMNNGVRSAYDLYGKFLSLDINLTSEPNEEINFSIANEIQANNPTPYFNDTIEFCNNESPQYIVVGINYYDPILKQSFTQKFFMKWNGVKNGKMYPDFFHISKEEKKKIEEYLIKFNITFS